MKKASSMLGDAQKISATVLKQVTPLTSERKNIADLGQRLTEKVASAARKLGVKAKVRVEGSVAKDTWLSKEPDIDVFMRVSKSIPRESLGKVCLRVAKEATRGSKQIEKFADHPYLEAFVHGVRVNIVPCYDAKQGEWLSATDRTPYHTDYINGHLTEQMRSEVRLLKKFMKGIGVYGAEIKVGGFSGYLSELLILHYGSFMETLKAFASAGNKTVIDIEEFYRDRRRELDLLFDGPLVVVDPVDKARNVASAVRSQRLHTLIAAAQEFIMRPSLEFFYPPKTVPLSTGRMRQELKKRESKVIFVSFGRVDAVPDVLWGQLYKSHRSLRRLIELNDFKVLRGLPWSDENDLNMFIFELEHCCLSPVKLHLGPPVDKEKERRRFITKHMNKPGTISGPYVEDGRWVILIHRKFTDACALLKEKLEDGGKRAGVAEQISQVLKAGFEVSLNEEVLGTYEKSGEFAEFLTDFLSGKPKWLESQSGSRL
jgi:tRNA nucleotidyltransferase (CCA-adding enzyme)